MDSMTYRHMLRGTPYLARVHGEDVLVWLLKVDGEYTYRAVELWDGEPVVMPEDGSGWEGTVRPVALVDPDEFRKERYLYDAHLSEVLGDKVQERWEAADRSFKVKVEQDPDDEVRDDA